MHEMTARQPKRVLLVEDDDTFALITTRMLELQDPNAPKYGAREEDHPANTHESKCIYGQWVVTVAGTLATASDLLHHNEFDIVLCDLILPDGQREDVIRIVSEARPELPIVVQSGIADGQMVQRMLLDGSVADYIVKGDITGSKALKQRLCHAIDRWHLMRDVDSVVSRCCA